MEAVRLLPRPSCLPRRKLRRMSRPTEKEGQGCSLGFLTEPIKEGNFIALFAYYRQTATRVLRARQAARSGSGKGSASGRRAACSRPRDRGQARTSCGTERPEAFDLLLRGRGQHGQRVVLGHGSGVSRPLASKLPELWAKRSPTDGDQPLWRRSWQNEHHILTKSPFPV